MIDLAQLRRVSVLVLGGDVGDLEQFKSILPDASIQWHIVLDREFTCLLGNLSRFDLALCKYAGDAHQLQCLEAIRNHNSTLPIIVFGSNWQVPMVVHVMKLGATEVCEFPDNLPELRGAFKRCLASETSAPARYSDVIPKTIQAKLTSEEARILHLLVQGRTTKEVGATLDVSIRTVHYRKKELLRKLGVQNRSEAIELIRLSSNKLFSLDSGMTAM